MWTVCSIDDLITLCRTAALLCQVGAALIAAVVGAATHGRSRRHGALALLHDNDALANLVHAAALQSADARATLGTLQEVIVGCPDDAFLLLYLNYVRSTYRMHLAGAVGSQIWRDTLAACAEAVRRLPREQVARLLTRGYEARFGLAVLEAYDRRPPTTVRDRATPALALAC